MKPVLFNLSDKLIDKYRKEYLGTRIYCRFVYAFNIRCNFSYAGMLIYETNKNKI